MNFVTKYSTIILLALIFVSGLFLRTVNLGRAPVALSIDEVGVAYNAYSILKTGKDEWGVPYPVSFRSIGDYKSPLLIYLTVPAIKLFGLTEWATRITVALFGTLTILVVFWLGRLLTQNRLVALLTATSFALSPWQLKPARMTHDATIALFFVLLAIALTLASEGRRWWQLVAGGICFILAMYGYHAEKVFVPLILIALAWIYRQWWLKFKKQVIVAAVVALVVAVPLVKVNLTPEGQHRADVTFFTNDVEIFKQFHPAGQALDLPTQILNSNLIIASGFWLKRYLDYYDLRFLFFDGMGYSLPDSPDIGLLYLFELPFVLIGIYQLFFKQRLLHQSGRWLILAWLLAGPVPAAFANNAQHAFRSMTLIPTLQLFSAVGIWTIQQQVTKRWRAWFWLGLAAVTLVSVIYLADLYFVQFQYNFSEYFGDGWKAAAQYILANDNHYQEVVVDPRFGTQGPYTVGTPYLYILFYGKIDPSLYQNDPRRKEFSDSSNFLNYSFRQIDWAAGPNSDRGKKNVLFIGSPWVLPSEDAQTLQRFDLLNGKEILRAATP